MMQRNNVRRSVVVRGGSCAIVHWERIHIALERWEEVRCTSDYKRGKRQPSCIEIRLQWEIMLSMREFNRELQWGKVSILDCYVDEREMMYQTIRKIER